MKRANGKGSIYLKGGAGYFGKWTAEIDGVPVRVTRKLNTTSELVARKLVTECAEMKCDLHAHPARAAQAKASGKASNGPTFEQAAVKVLVTDSNVPNHPKLLDRLRLHVFEHIGGTAVRDVSREEIEALLVNLRDKGLSHQSVKHIRQAIGIVLTPFYADAPTTITENGRQLRSTPATQAALPKFTKDVHKERARLTDDELVMYLRWEHPLEHRRKAVRERQTMAAISRCLGGVRSGDLHAMRWENFDVDRGGFTWGWAPRNKTRTPQKLVIPEVLRPVLRSWWQEHGSPREGLVFPALRGDQAGEGQKIGVSHAGALRRDLQAAFTWAVPAGVGAPTPASTRWRELFTETDYRLPVDFHSFRRAFADGLRRAGTNEQTARAFGGWASDAMNRYLGTEDVVVPETALPRFEHHAVIVASRRHFRTRAPRALSPTGTTGDDLEADESSEVPCFMAPPAGVEPATFSLGSRCSIQLSYGSGSARIARVLFGGLPGWGRVDASAGDDLPQ